MEHSDPMVQFVHSVDWYVSRLARLEPMGRSVSEGENDHEHGSGSGKVDGGATWVELAAWCSAINVEERGGAKNEAAMFE